MTAGWGSNILAVRYGNQPRPVVKLVAEPGPERSDDSRLRVGDQAHGEPHQRPGDGIPRSCSGAAMIRRVVSMWAVIRFARVSSAVGWSPAEDRNHAITGLPFAGWPHLTCTRSAGGASAPRGSRHLHGRKADKGAGQRPRIGAQPGEGT